MLLSHTVFSIFEVLLVILPVLIGVAFVTVAERKTMASMQRRLGPNIVGQLKLNLSFKKSYHTSSYDKAISTLYRNRKVPGVISFQEKATSVRKDLLSPPALKTLFYLKRTTLIARSFYSSSSAVSSITQSFSCCNPY